ncbi:MAG: methyltransferase domain-containing protein [Rhodospirillaceae bacterium]|nr:methyltransferase domain-containing protein [Rhodospirillaceae bacterium]
MAEQFSIFDRRAVRAHRDRAARRRAIGADAEFLHREIGDRLLERLDEVKRGFACVLDLGCRDGFLARALARRAGVERVMQADVSPAFARLARAANRFFPTVVADEETLPFAPGSFDLVVSNLALHWVNDLPGALIQLRRALKPDGLLLAAMFGGETLTELRQALLSAEITEEGGASPRVSPHADVRDAGALLQRAGFALPLVDRDRIQVTYEHVFSLMADLRLMGETNALRERRRGFTRRSTMLTAAEEYLRRYADKSGRLIANFDIVYLTAWAPGPGQPQPLKPGSAAHRLAEALRTEEHVPGEGEGEKR